MATRTIPAVTEITDDFTGKVISADDKPVKVEITVKVGAGAPVKGSLDAATAMAGRLVAFVSEPTDENRRALGDTIPRSRVGASGSGSGSGGSRQPVDKAGVTMRAWMREHGWPNVKDGQGRVPEDAKTAWENHLTAEKSAAA
jgi:hypothetical protein